MNAHMAVDFCWENLVRYIHEGDVIPVIGEGVYWVRPKAHPETEPFLLYPFLADTFVTQMGLEPGQPKDTFFQAVFRYQEGHPEIKTPDGKYIISTSKDGTFIWATPETILEYLKTAGFPKLTAEEKKELGIEGFKLD